MSDIFNAYLHINEVILPVASYGVCKNYSRCKQFDVDLGNGYCIDCYDRGLDKRGRVMEGYTRD